jgi:hypothetical protein
MGRNRYFPVPSANNPAPETLSYWPLGALEASVPRLLTITHEKYVHHPKKDDPPAE